MASNEGGLRLEKALASERFWENKAECDDAEKNYILSLNPAKACGSVPEVAVPVPVGQPAAVGVAKRRDDDDSDIDLFASDEDSPPASAPAPKGKPQLYKPPPNQAKGPGKPKQEKVEAPAKTAEAAAKVEAVPAVEAAAITSTHPNKERTFLMLKPDAVQRGLAGQIIGRFEKKGFKLVAMKVMVASTDLLKQHYADLAKKPFFPELVRYMASGPVLPMVWEGLNVVKTGRVMLGETNPRDSAPGTIRGDFCVDIGRNIIHGSDSVASAAKEIALWFGQGELVAWRPCPVEWIYEDEVPDDDADIVDKMVSDKLVSLESENKALKKATDDLRALILGLEKRVATLEGKSGVKPAPAPAPAKAEDDEDVDLFGSSDDDEDDEKAKVREERLKAYAEKKSKKPALIAKTSVLLDVKPWDDETDMDKMLESVKTIVKEGLVWGASKLVPVGYGINKLQVMCVVEDEKVSIDELCEQIQEFEDYVQSVDIAAMSKI